MYNNGNQYAQGYSNNYDYNYTGANYGLYNNYTHSQQGYDMSGSLQPGPPGDEYPQNNWAPVETNYNIASTQQKPATLSSSASSDKTDAVVEEKQKHNAELIKQRDEYEKRIYILKKQLDLLRKEKQNHLSDDGSVDRSTGHLLKENEKLQVEIQSKIKDAYKVIDILTNVIGDDKKIAQEDDMSHKHKERHRRSMSTDKSSSKSKYNYLHYDPELHWCRLCDVFPKTAKDLLNHLHSKEHLAAMQEENLEAPWHKLPKEPEFPFYENATTKRLPIKGLQFFMPSTAWYCRLCDTWIGDLHCASLHLKSLTHSQNYSNFVEQNPHWEIEWLKDREKAFERINRSKDSDSDEADGRKKRKHKDKYSSSDISRDKKRKKKSKKRRRHSSDSSSSSSSSDSSSDEYRSDKSKSIRVAMRNKMKSSLLENSDHKWEVLGRIVEEERKRKESLTSQAPQEIKVPEYEDGLINQWMTVKKSDDNNKDKYILDSLKDRLKIKQEQEKIKMAELEKKRREKELAEKEAQEKLEREAKDLEERRRKEEEEKGKLKEKDREQVRFNQRAHYRTTKRSPSLSPKRSRSRSNDRFDRKYSEYKRSSSPDSPYKNSKEENKRDKKTLPTPYKRLPFIGRMPLFKNKKPEEKVEKEIKKEEYETPRQTRFQPGTLARSFIPDPEVVCFPRLSSYPPLTIPPPAPPAPPKISEEPPTAPPPPKITKAIKEKKNIKPEQLETTIPAQIEDLNEPKDYEESMNMMYPPMQGINQQYAYDYNMIYPHPTYDYSQDVPIESELIPPPPPEIINHSFPIQPPPLPPDEDDLALLGMSSDDLAAQTM